jgi:flagella basal body P-ring formation protein FlgA
MQMLCRPLNTSWKTPFRLTGPLAALLLSLASLLLPFSAQSQTQPPSRVQDQPKLPPEAPAQLAARAARQTGTQVDANASPQDKLMQQARQWVAQSQQIPPSMVEFAPLDSRLRIQDCPQALALDYPFASRETLRVRCQGEPGWQLYMRVMTATPPAATPVAAPPPASSLTAGQAAQAGAPAATRKTVITRRLLQRGTVLEPDMLEEVSRPQQGLDPQAVSSLQDVQLAELTRDVPAGAVLRSYDIKRAILVKQGQTALLNIGQGAGFQITVRVEALQDGHMGQQIRLKNPESGRLLSGVVTGPNAVRGLQNSF